MDETTNDRQTHIPAMGETDLDEQTAIHEEQPAPSDDMPYQNDIDYRDDKADPVMNEENDNPANELGIPENEYRDELNKVVDTDIGTGDDDMRETIEDRDEADDNAASSPQ